MGPSPGIESEQVDEWLLWEIVIFRRHTDWWLGKNPDGSPADDNGY